MPQPSRTLLLDVAPATSAFLRDVITGLSRDEKELPCKYLYDERGSQLFELICELDEYYPTRTELALMERHSDEIAYQIGPEVMLVEYGSGSSIKTRILLDHLQDPVAYVPVDISKGHLQRTSDSLAAHYPRLEVLPVCADFTQPFTLPESKRTPSHAAVYFPGSTIGNFSRPQARRLLRQISMICGRGGGLVIGIDLQKDVHVLEAAYNDREGVTGEFNLNLLARINRELGADFELDQFEHLAEYNRSKGRIEMNLVSQAYQTVTIGDDVFTFEPGERICTEHSHKYTIDGFAEIARTAGLELRRSWTDSKEWFAVLHLVVE